MIRIITGFREDQHFTIPDSEAHKAYYLFLNPEQRGVFSNGVAVIGKNIQSITPDYNAEMGWNPTHQLEEEDWNEIRRLGVDRKLQKVLADARRIAYLVPTNPRFLSMKLEEVEKQEHKLLS